MWNQIYTETVNYKNIITRTADYTLQYCDFRCVKILKVLYLQV